MYWCVFELEKTSRFRKLSIKPISRGDEGIKVKVVTMEGPMELTESEVTYPGMSMLLGDGNMNENVSNLDADDEEPVIQVRRDEASSNHSSSSSTYHGK